MRLDDSMEEFKELSVRRQHSSCSDRSVIDDEQSREDETNNFDEKIATRFIILCISVYRLGVCLAENVYYFL